MCAFMNLLQFGGGATCSSDLLYCACGECVGSYINLDGDVAGAEHLHGLVLANGALLNECLNGDSATFGEQFVDAVQVNNLELDAEGVLEAAQLGQAHVQRQ